MKKEDKNNLIGQLQREISSYSHFYLTDIEGLNAQKTSDLRRACFKKEVKLVVAKNKLLHKALQNLGVGEDIFVALKGNTALMLSNMGNAPAKLIKEFTKNDKDENARPILKAAYVEETIYVGRQNLDVLATIKSKNELIADVVMLLQSPMKQVVSALQSSGQTIHGVLKTLEEKKN